MSSAFINKHITRVLAAGFDASTIDSSWLDTVDAWLTPADDLRHWANPAFGVVKSGSVISKVANLGATRLPFGGDLTMNTANSSYVTGGSGIGGLPAWNNSTGTAQAYFGAARDGTIRYNSIRRLYRAGITMVAVYTKSGTGQVCPVSIGEQGGLALQNTSGSPGNAKFFVGGYGNAWTAPDTSSSTIANSTVHIIGGTFDGPSLAVKVYVEGVAAGPGATATNYFPLVGGVDSTTSQRYILASGSTEARMGSSLSSPDDSSPTFLNGEATMTISDLIVFGSALSPTRMASLNTLIRNRIGP